MLAVFDRERKKVYALAGRVGANGGAQEHRVAVADDDRAVGLFGHLAGLDRQVSVTEFDGLFQIFLYWHFVLSPSTTSARTSHPWRV